MAKPPVEFTLDQRSLTRLRDAMAKEANGKALKRDLNKQLRRAAAPAVSDVKSAVRSLPASEAVTPGLRDTIAAGVKPQVRYSGRSTGVRIAASRKGMPRNFKNAPRVLNKGRWRHPIYGTDSWAEQTTNPGWFDSTLKGHRDDFKRAVMKAMDEMAERLADRIKRG